MKDKPQVLYRFYDHNDRLLYVGISQRMPDRIGQHRRSKPWQEVKTITLEHFATRKEAMVAELEAIASEGPKWNILGADRHSTLEQGRGRKRPVEITKPQMALWRKIHAKGPLYYLRHNSDTSQSQAWLMRGSPEVLNLSTVNALIRKGLIVRLNHELVGNVHREQWMINPTRTKPSVRKSSSAKAS